MKRERRYTGATLRKAVRAYFSSISRTVTVTEPVPSGEVDQYGHPILIQQPILDDDGAPIRRREYVNPPTLGGLCRALGIHRATWARWADAETYPEFADTVEWAREEVRAWLEEQLHTRPGKDVKGIIFDLQANFGLRERREIEMGPQAARAVQTSGTMTLAEREELLREIAAEYGRQDGETG